MEFIKIADKIYTELNTDEALRVMDMQIGQMEAQLKEAKDNREKILNSIN